MAIRLAIADDHTMFREGLRRLLEARYDMKVVAEAGNGEEAIAAVRSASPDVVLMDVDMPGMDGIAATESIHAERPDLGIIVVSMHIEDEYILRAYEAGASGYVLKSWSAEEMARTIRSVAAGQAEIGRASFNKILERLRHLASRVDGQEAEKLSPRQIDVVRLLATGATNREIADRLGYAEKTIKNELTEVYRILNVVSRSQAVAEGFRRGLLKRSG